MASLRPEKYTVGWIAALPDEATAALELLDEPHEKPAAWTQPATDTNKYEWGRINKHNVVLAYLPLGGIGTNNAAIVATTMLSTFPSVRFGLMVGIGAGVPAPPERDIRLGDVVIGKPGDDNGGVVQYDLGKAQGDGKFRRVGMLDKPPKVLLTAISGLHTKQTRRRTQIKDFISGIKDEIRDEEEYRYQGVHNDRLFQDSHPHPKGSKDCGDCPKEWEAARNNPAKPDRTKGPRIFFGSIASGNTVVKNANRRAEIVGVAGKDTMCIEMEAAGLMDAFPCLVIRGICDYADSHKNDKWQRYAALTAAATAKELLLGMDAGEVEGTKPASDVVDQSQPPPLHKRSNPPLAPAMPQLGSRPVNDDELDKMRKRLGHNEVRIQDLEKLQDRIKASEDRILENEIARARVDQEQDRKIRDLQTDIARLSSSRNGNGQGGNGSLQQRLEKTEVKLGKLKKRVEELEEEEVYSSEEWHGCH